MGVYVVSRQFVLFLQKEAAAPSKIAHTRRSALYSNGRIRLSGFFMTQITYSTPLTQLAVLRLTGEDTASFLQGQLTNDVTKVTTNTLLTAGWCSPRGRLLTVFRLVKSGGDFLLIVPADDIEAVMKRLRMYVLRSRVKVALDTSLKAVGVVGEPTAPCFTQTSGTDAALNALGLPAGRALVLVPADEAPEEDAALESLYWAASAAAGDVFVFLPVKEQFVPQGINLELTGGVSFTKGCYTGQEIVSRVEHIGKTPRRAALYRADKCLPAGTVVKTAAGEEAGIVVYGGTAPQGAAMLIQVANDTVGEPLAFEDMTLTPLPLPYSYERQH